MMRYYIVDDEIGVVKTLENIFESRNLGGGGRLQHRTGEGHREQIIALRTSCFQTC